MFSSHFILLKLTLISSVDSDVHIYFLNDDKKNETHILMILKIQASSDNYRNSFCNKIRRKRRKEQSCNA